MRIDAVLFDLGGTLEDVRYDHESRLLASGELKRFLSANGIDLPGDAEAILERVERGCAAYREWCERTMVEAPADQVWAEWYLRDFGISRASIAPFAEGLASIWETRFHSRSLRPEARATLADLAERGYKLGVISNTSSEAQVRGALDAYGIGGFFGCLCLSCVSGIRKPDPRIFREALFWLGTQADHAAYVGDTVSRDIAGSKAAGYALAFQIRSFLTAGRDSALPPGSPQPDYVVGRLGEVVSILDGLGARAEGETLRASRGLI